MRNPRAWVVALLVSAGCDCTSGNVHLDGGAGGGGGSVTGTGGGSTGGGSTGGGSTGGGSTGGGSTGGGVQDAGTDAGFCGNGFIDVALGELCDTGISAGSGACPAACDAGVCMTSMLAGLACQTQCMSTPITLPANGDRCCPNGAHSLIDDDCAPVCGNALVEANESCDTALDAGAGSCPTSCDDSNACTLDALDGGGTCRAACERTAITLPMSGDLCCPPGANASVDNDCMAICGNAVVEPMETCDIAIVDGGAGTCLSSCADAGACMPATLVDAGTCAAACTYASITTPMNGDGCCPPGANANNDMDCPPRCGNMVVEAGEQCDDGNMNPSDACNNLCQNNPVAFQLRDRDLRDPHVFVSFLGCRDVTDTPLSGFAINSAMQTSIQTDGDFDGYLDDSTVLLFPNGSPQGAVTAPLQIHQALCTAPLVSTMCRAPPAPPTNVTATMMSTGQCLTFLAGTVRPYMPSIASTGSPCFVTSPFTYTVSLAGVPVTLRDTRVAATFVGNPAGSMINGLVMGFISEADANATLLPATLPLVGGQRLSAVLPGGTGNCAAHNDKDLNAGVVGWWFYFNFPATSVPWN